MNAPANQPVRPAVRTQSELEYAFEAIEEEHETLLALAIVLESHLSPPDPTAPDECDIVSWRLSQVIHERLTDTRFLRNMRELMLGTAPAVAVKP